MTTFQAVIYSVVHGFTEFLPVGSSAHQLLISYFLNWPEPNGAFSGALSLGAFLSLIIYFRHDWASMISCFLQIIFYRKRPMTLDERLPLFIAAATLPSAVLYYYFQTSIEKFQWTPLWIAGSLVGFAIPLWLADSFSRKNKAMFDWNLLDSLFVGIAQAAMVIPGGGRMAAAIPGALFRNFSREAAAKFTYYLAAPIVGATAFFHIRSTDFHAIEPMEGLSWWSYGVAVLVTTLVGLLAIGGFMKQVVRKGYGQYIFYRFLLAVGTCAVYWFRNNY